MLNLSTAFVNHRPEQVNNTIFSSYAVPENRSLTMPRFTPFINLGFTLNYDFNRSFGLMSGLVIHNIGYINKAEYYDPSASAWRSATIKHRVYSIAVPLGLKIGDLRNRNYFLLGGGIDLPFHYKEKLFRDRNAKISKTSFWYADKSISRFPTPRIMPFVYMGRSFDPGIIVKLQYYPGNFLDPTYSISQGSSVDNVFPFDNYKVHLLLLSLGVDIHYRQYKIQEREYRKMKK